MATARRTTKAATMKRKTATKPRAKKAAAPAGLEIVNKDIVIQPVQYVVMDGYVIVNENDNGAVSKDFDYPRNEYGDEVGASQRFNLNNAHVYRTKENQAYIQFRCGDYLFLHIDQMIELLQAVKGLDITIKPRFRDE